MQALFRSISRYLVLVILTSILPPVFAGQAGLSPAEHQHGVTVMAAGAAHHAEHLQPGANDASVDHAPATHGSATHADASCCADVQHHCCPGHQLGHPQGNVVALLLPIRQARLALVLSERFLTRDPEGLERPPRAIAV